MQSLQERQRSSSRGVAARQQARSPISKRAQQALAALQAKVGHGKDIDGWLAAGRPRPTRRSCGSALDVERGWERRARSRAARAARGARACAPRRSDRLGSRRTHRRRVRLALYAPASGASRVPTRGGDALLAKVRLKRPELGRLLADALHGVRCRDSISRTRLRDRDALGVGESFVTPAGHLVTAQTRDAVRAGQRAARRARAAARARGARGQRSPTRARSLPRAARARSTPSRPSSSHAAAGVSRREPGARPRSSGARTTSSSSCVQLKQAAEAAEKRRAQLAQDRADADRQADNERAAARRDRTRDRRPAVAAARRAREARRRPARAQRSRSRARRAAASGCARPSARRRKRASPKRGRRDRLAELERRRESLLATSASSSRRCLTQLTSERAGDRLDAGRGRRCSASSRLRGDAEAGAGRGARRAGGAWRDRCAPPRRRGSPPSRSSSLRAQKIQDMQLKEQAAALAEQQFAEQLAEAHADARRACPRR